LIRRFNDYDVFSNSELEKIAEVVSNKERTTLFELADNEEKALLTEKELKVQGYNVRIEKFKDKYKVFAIMPETLEYREAMQSGQFKKLAWGRYAFQRESALGMFKYDFDDGTIWKVMTGSDGKEYLVKEVSDENEEEVIRNKTASTNFEKIAVNDNNVKTILKILYDNLDNEFINDLLATNVKEHVYSMLSNKLDKVIISQIEQNNFIQSPSYNKDIKEVITAAINGEHIKTKAQLGKLVVEHTNQFIAKTGKVESIFS
jgi:hypothetical protein